MLEARRLEVSYGAAPAINGVDLKVDAGALVVVVGPNGAGKTTLINALSGVHRIHAGTLTMGGEVLNRVAPHRFCEHGIALVPEGRRLFTGLTVRENLELGSYTRAAKARRAESLDRAFTMFPILQERARQAAGTLSGGEQQMLAIARALMALPRLLMLDEPSLGLAPRIVKDIFRTIADINRAGTAVLLVEQNTRQALALSRRGYVLENGRVVLMGAGAELLGNDHVKRAYLGM